MNDRPMAALPAQSESDVNSTPLRAARQSQQLSERSRELLGRDNRAFLHQSVSFKTTMGNVLTLTPPWNLTDAELDRALDALDDCLSEEGRLAQH